MEFSKESRELLTNAGWFEGRSVDVVDVERYLTEVGSHVSNAARSFLSEFHGIHFKAEYYRVVFDVYKTTRHCGTKEDIKHLESILGEQLCVIGDICYSALFMTSSGQVVSCAIDWSYYRIFENYHMMIETYVSNDLHAGKTHEIEDSQLPEWYQDDSDDIAIIK